MTINSRRSMLGVITTLLAGALLLYFIWLKSPSKALQRELSAAQEKPLQLDPAAQTLTQSQADTAETTSRAFAEHYQNAVQQKSDASDIITTLLTPRAAAIVAKRDTIAEGLQYFVRDSRLPNDITVTSVQKKHDTFAEATTTWHFGQHVETKYFYLQAVDDQWRIDSVQTVTQ